MTSPERLDALRNVASAFALEVRAALGDRVDSIVLYGSVARGDIHEDSDVDVLVIGPDMADHRKRVEEIASVYRRLDGDDLTYLQTFTYDRDNFLRLYRIHAPYAENVVEDGVVLYDTGLFTQKGIYSMRQGSPAEYVQEMLNRAGNALDQGHLLMDAGQYDGAASRIYYAAFYAAQAALVHVGVRPSTNHGRVQRQFDTQIVSTALIDARFEGLLGAAYELRVKGDYDYTTDVLKGEAGTMADDVERLIAALRAMTDADPPVADTDD